MGATLNHEGRLRVLRLAGMLRKSELDIIQWGEAGRLTADERVDVLVIAENFEGWHRDDTWGDVSFIATHGRRIGKIAIVAEPQWKDHFLMFTGAGFRPTQIKFFFAGQEPLARDWLAGEDNAGAGQQGIQ